MVSAAQSLVEASGLVDELSVAVRELSKTLNVTSHRCFGLCVKAVESVETCMLTDLTYAIHRKADQTLWTQCWKLMIDKLQERIRTSRSVEDLSILNLFLATAYAFFTQLLVKLSFNFPQIHIHRLDEVSLGELATIPPELSHMIQFCLIHLGDISRYQKDQVQAESLYTLVCRILPSCGHAWNQRGILQTHRGHHFQALYFYIRSLNVENAFFPASANVDKYYYYLVEKYKDVNIIKVNTKEETLTAIQVLMAYIHHEPTYELIGLVNGIVDCELCEQLSGDEFTQVMCLCLASIYSISPWDSSNNNYMAKLDQLASEERVAHTIISRFMVELMHKLVQFCCENKLQNVDDYLGCVCVMLKWLNCMNSLSLVQLMSLVENISNTLLQLVTVYSEIPHADCVSDVLLPEDLGVREFLPISSIYHIEPEEMNIKQCSFDPAQARIKRMKRIDSACRNILISICRTLNPDNLDEIEQIFHNETWDEDVRIRLREFIAQDKFAPYICEREPCPEQKGANTPTRKTRVAPILAAMASNSLEDNNCSFDQIEDKLLDNSMSSVKKTPPGMIKVVFNKNEQSKIGDKEEEILDKNANETDIKVSACLSKSPFPPRFQAQKLKQALTGKKSDGPYVQIGNVDLQQMNRMAPATQNRPVNCMPLGPPPGFVCRPAGVGLHAYNNVPRMRPGPPLPTQLPQPNFGQAGDFAFTLNPNQSPFVPSHNIIPQLGAQLTQFGENPGNSLNIWGNAVPIEDANQSNQVFSLFAPPNASSSQEKNNVWAPWT